MKWMTIWIHWKIDDFIKKYIKAKNEFSWKNFDDYVKTICKVRAVSFNASRWMESKCHCCYFQKNYVCKHIILIAIRQKLCDVPYAAKSIPLGSKPARGRPKKATVGGLNKQK